MAFMRPRDDDDPGEAGRVALAAGSKGTSLVEPVQDDVLEVTTPNMVAVDLINFRFPIGGWSRRLRSFIQ